MAWKFFPGKIDGLFLLPQYLDWGRHFNLCRQKLGGDDYTDAVLLRRFFVAGKNHQ